MDSTLILKSVVAGFASICVMILVMTSKVDGATALDFLKWVVGPFLVGAAALGVADKLSGNKDIVSPGGNMMKLPVKSEDK